MSSPRSRTKTSPDSPEITTDTASMGRETLVAIAEDEADQARALLDRKLRASRQAPPVPAPPPARKSGSLAPPARAVVPPARPASQRPAAAAPAARPSTTPGQGPRPGPLSAPGPLPLRGSPPGRRPPSSPGARPPQVTLDYHDMPLSGDLEPGDRESTERAVVDVDARIRPAVERVSTPHERPRSAPELIETSTRPMGRDTLAAITGDLAQELLRALSLEERAGWEQQLEGALTLEPFRFEVRGAPMLERPNDVLRREFVAVRLLHRLPVRSVDEVVRVDVTPASEPDSLLLTLWVKVPERG